MKGKRYTEEQIVGVLKRLENGEGALVVGRELGISQQTIYAWKRKYQGMEKADVVRMRFLEQENSKLKKLVADLSLDNLALKEINSKNW